MKVFSKRSSKSNEQGIALITAIFSILLATVIGFALYYSAAIAMTIATNERDNTEAFYITDAGIEHAKALIGKVESSKLSLILKAGTDPSPNTGDELSTPPVAGIWAASASIPAGNNNTGGVVNFGAGGNGRYWVSVKNDTATGETPLIDLNGILIVTSTGKGRDGASATIESTIKSLPPLPAVLINGNANISGSVRVAGNNGILHTNGTLEVNGNPCADQYFSTSASVVNPQKAKGSSCHGPGAIRSNQPIIEPPIYNIRNDFYGRTDYILGAIGTNAGKVYNGSGSLISDTTVSGNKWIEGAAQWTWNPLQKTWIQSGTSILNASFYTEGNIAITGSFGSSLNPAEVTFIAEGSIYNQGKQYMTPKYQNFSLVAGADLKISGKLNTEAEDLEMGGISYAHHQINFSGTPTLKGTVIAANQADTVSPGGTNFVPLSSGFMNISGNATIIVDVITPGGVKILSWREVRH
jgi:hypothetical protein